MRSLNKLKLLLGVVYGISTANMGYAGEAPNLKEKQVQEILQDHSEELIKKREEDLSNIWNYCKENKIAPYLLNFNVSGHIKLPDQGLAVSHHPFSSVVGPGYYKVSSDSLERVLNENNADLYFKAIEEDGKIEIESKNNMFEIAIPPLGYGFGPCDEKPDWGNITKFNLRGYRDKPRLAMRKKDDPNYNIMYTLDTMVEGNILALDMKKIDLDEKYLLKPYGTQSNEK